MLESLSQKILLNSTQPTLSPLMYKTEIRLIVHIELHMNLLMAVLIRLETDCPSDTKHSKEKLP